jgi:hypothetical protein
VADEHLREKTHHECKCPDCNNLTAMADRVSAWKSAGALLKETTWAEDDVPSVREHMVLADWLLYGPDALGSGD